jgi:ribosomal protein S18 acetylase RimI-like enzyme
MSNPRPGSSAFDPLEGWPRTLDLPERGQTPFRVRRARVEDAGGIARVWVRAWQIAYRGLVPDEVLEALSVGDRRALWNERLEGGDCTFVVEDRGIAGYCRVVKPGELSGLYVLPERRHGGIGSALLAAGLDELRPHSDHATLWVFTDNHAARAFYAQFGFTPDGAEGVNEGTGLPEIRLRVEL